MKETLSRYLRVRASALGLTLSDVCKQAGLSRQTLYSFDEIPRKLPELKTLVALSGVLQVHPLRLLQLIFDEVPLHAATTRRHKRGDKSTFVRDVSIPDGTPVMPGERFVKTWESQNIGNVPWDGRFLQCIDEDIVVYQKSGERLNIAGRLTPQSERVAVPFTAPGAKVQISVEFVAPSSPGTLVSYWKTVFEDGKECFPNSLGLWVKVNVVSLARAYDVEERK